MNRLFLMLCCLGTFLAPPAGAAPPEALPGLQPPARPDGLRLRNLRLKEAVARGELSKEEALRMRQFYRRHEAMRPLMAPWQASQPAMQRPAEGPRQRWRKKQEQHILPADRADD